MFNCEKCGKTSSPGEKSHAVVVERREHKFPFRSRAQRFVRDGKVMFTDDPGGVGTQIVREMRMCGPCKDVAVRQPAGEGVT